MSIRVWYCVKDDKFFPTMSAGIDHCHYHVEKYGGVIVGHEECGMVKTDGRYEEE